VLALTASTCGKNGTRKAHPQASAKVEGEFRKAAAADKVPVRLVMAAAWLESRISAEAATSLYLDSSESGDGKKGVQIAQSAFGIPLASLGLEGREDASDLAVQIGAYTSWLAKSVGSEANLPANPSTPDEKFDWAWEMAKAHRASSERSRNIRVVFTKELIKVLNDGFIWQDRETGEFIRFPKENPPLKVSDFREDSQRLFSLTTQRPQIESATFLKLGRTDVSPTENHPEGVEVIHCPFTLSACLELQSQAVDDQIRLEAHYVIPQDDLVVEEPLQVTRHENAVRLTDSHGVTDFVQNQVVVMLVGNSGRLIDGYRDPANPGWTTKWQLQRLGDIINDLCLTLHDGNANVAVKDCLSNVKYHVQGVSEAFRWGDVADFDPMIYSGYIESPGGLQGEAAFKFPNDVREFLAGSDLPLTVVFAPSVRHVELERMVRCPDRKVVWAPLTAGDVRNQTSFALRQRFYDAGPNGNGSQFFRAKVYGADGSLVGWDTAEVFLRNYEKDGATMTPKPCLTQGS
jgi:hypothetical protein